MLGTPSLKCVALVEMCRRKKFVLASGPRLSGKTFSCLQAVCDHAWNTKNGNIVIISLSQSAGLDSGIWDDLVKEVIPSFGLEITRQPYTQSVSKKQALEVRNKFGQSVKIQLDSLVFEAEVEARFKSKRYSAIYIPELSNYRLRRTFNILREALRMVGVPDSEHLFLADTNPADEGEKSWIYQMWYVLRAAEDYDVREKPIRDNLGLVEFDLSDNIYSAPERIDELKADYAHDPDLYDRYVLGKWVTASEGALFYTVFRPNIHVIGDPETPANPDPDRILPTADCFELLTGWDLGIVNSAFHIIEKYFQEFEFVTNEGIMKMVLPCFSVLDELVIIGEDFELADFTLEALKKMAFWEDFVGHPVRWTHWSDSSAFDFKRLGDNYEHQVVTTVSGGKIILQPATKTKDMVRQRINLLRKLFFQNRIFISACCDKTVSMAKSLKKGRGSLSVIEKHSPHKHPFDSLTYPISMECFEELAMQMLKQVRPRVGDASESGMIAVGL